MADLSKFKKVPILLPGLSEKNITDRLLSNIATKLNEMLGSKWEAQEVSRVPALTYSDAGHELSLTDITLRVSFVRKPNRAQSTRPRPAPE